VFVLIIHHSLNEQVHDEFRPEKKYLFPLKSNLVDFEKKKKVRISNDKSRQFTLLFPS
jgi:hypothetical protein